MATSTHVQFASDVRLLSSLGRTMSFTTDYYRYTFMTNAVSFSTTTIEQREKRKTEKKYLRQHHAQPK